MGNPGVWGEGVWGAGNWGFSQSQGGGTTTNPSILQNGVLNRLEDDGTFWSLTGEVIPLLIEAMCAATLITGEPQVKSSQVYTVPVTTPGVFTPLPLPTDCVALTRVQAAGGITIDKYFIWDIDRDTPNWENETGPQAKAWIPFGLSSFGIYPNLTAPQNVMLSYIALPVASARPYTGSEAVPFQVEFQEAFEDYAAAMLRFKEGGQEFQQGMELLNRFLEKMEEMSRFAYRKGSLRFSRAMGAQAQVSDVAVR